MAARVMWKAELRIARKKIPVDLYSAVRDSGLHLHLLQQDQGTRIQQRMVDPHTGEVVPPERTRRGIEIERGRFVLLEADELAALEPEASRAIEVRAFVPHSRIDHRWYERPYWLGPGRGHAEDHAALVLALENTGLAGFARWTMRKREYAGALHSYRGSLVLIALRPADAVLAASSLEAPEGRELEPRELELARQLVAALAGPFEHDRFRDEYRARVLDLVEKKRKGRKITVSRWKPARVDDDSLEQALRKSLEKAG